MVKTVFFVMAAMLVMTGKEAAVFPAAGSAEAGILSGSSKAEEESGKEKETDAETETKMEAEAETETETETETKTEIEAAPETELETAPVITKISQQEALAIAEKEAEKECYDYQGWDSLFKVNGSPTLCMTEEELLKEGLVRYERLKGDDPSYYEGRPIWSMRLIDETDPLTSLFLYVDAETGEILGYRTLSD